MVRRVGIAWAATKLVDCPSLQFAVPVPLNELEEAVAGHSSERAIFLRSAIDGAKRVGPAAQREVFIIPNQAVDFALLDVDPAKVFTKIFRSLLKLVERSFVFSFSFARI